MKQETKRLPQHIASLSVCLGSLSAGTVLGWTGNIAEDMKSESYRGIPIDDNSLGWIGSMATLGAAVGCIATGKLCDLIGRRKALLLQTIPFMIGWAFIIFPQSLTMIYIGRFLTGMAASAFLVAVPIYTSEIAEKEIRGTLGGYSVFLLTIGILISYTFPVFTTMTVYTICMGVLPIFFTIAFYFQPESPVYTVKINKEKKAETALMRLRGSKYDFETEIQDIKKSLLEDSESQITFSESIKKKATRKAFIVSFGLMFFQQIAGMNAIVFYGGTIFESAGSTLDPKVATINLGLLQVITSFISSNVVDRLGRRILLIASCLVTAISCLALGIFFTLKERSLVTPDTLSTLGLLPVISLSCFVTLYCLGLGPLPWLMPTELFPSEVRSLGCGLSGTFNWLMAFLVTKFYLDVKNVVGGDVTFYFFSIVSFVGTGFTYIFVPETKGKTLNEIQIELNK